MAPSFRCDPDLREARTPPVDLYFDPAWHAAVVRDVLQTSWMLILEASASTASAVPCTVAGEPLVLTRTPDGERLLSNVCTHRGAQIVTCPTDARSLRCPYHGRKFTLDGQVISAPGFEGVDLSGGGLTRAGLETLGPWRFGAVASPPPFEPVRAAVMDRLQHLPYRALDLQWAPDRDRDFPIEASWIQYVENYLEGFHIPFVHPELARSLVLDAYEQELNAAGTLQIGFARDDEPAFEPVTGPEAGRRVAAYYFWLFPCTMLNVYPWGVSVNRVDADGPGRCRVRYRSYVADPTLMERGAGAALDLVEAQDQEVVTSVARGVRARLYPGGRYSPAHEVGVHHFHRALALRLG